MKKVLPILDNQIPKTISYSATSNFDLCSFYYLLCDILRLKPWKNTVDTIFGTYVHKAVQDVISNKQTVEQAIKVFSRKWKKFCGLYRTKVSEDDKALIEAGVEIIKKVQGVLQKEFGNFQVLSIEEKLDESLEGFPQKFKGFIDTVLLSEIQKRIIIDFKTSWTAYLFSKYKDTIKDYQLTLYKHFYAKKHNINPDDIETYFIVLEKNIKSKDFVVPIRITSGKIKVANALKWLQFALSAINAKRFYRDRTSCLKYGEGSPCVFMNTEYCKK